MKEIMYGGAPGGGKRHTLLEAGFIAMPGTLQVRLPDAAALACLIPRPPIESEGKQYVFVDPDPAGTLRAAGNTVKEMMENARPVAVVAFIGIRASVKGGIDHKTLRFSVEELRDAGYHDSEITPLGPIIT